MTSAARHAPRSAAPANAPANANISLELRRHAREAPERLAVRAPDGATITFGALEARVNALARGLAELGLARGDRVSLFVRPGVEIVALTHALFRIGAVPVLIDPGMGAKSLLAAIRRMGPRALIGVPRVHALRRFFPGAFRSVELALAVGRGPAFGARGLAEAERSSSDAFAPLAADAGDEAAVLFTSGSTGPAKGVAYTHGNFAAQLAALRELYDLRPGEVDLACFPLFALFDHALGMTSVFPEMDVTRPASADPAKIAAAIERSGATFAFGSPAIWRRVLPWMRREARRFSTLARITIAGAPVPPELVLGLRDLLADVPGADVHTPYGATEVLPVASIRGAELAALRNDVAAGAGTCVGRPAPGAEVRIIALTDDAITRMEDARECAPAERGEICVRGPAVTREYKHEPGATALAKIADGRGGFWHRMGDAGYLDGAGRLWFCGRTAHRIETAAGVVFPVPVENVFLEVPGVERAALVGVGPRGAKLPVLVVEPAEGAARAELLARVERRRAEVQAAAAVARVLLRRGFPLDVRHNAKIDRLALAAWAGRKLR